MNLVVAAPLGAHHCPRHDLDNETYVPFALTGHSHYVDDALPLLRAEGGDCAGGSEAVIAFDWQAGGSGDESFRGKSCAYTVRKGDYTGALQETKRDAVAVPVDLQNLRMGRGDTTGTLDTSRPSHGGGQAIQAGMVVRRLTPTEAERLMGVPDGYTSVPYRGKPATDSVRYRALGNSMAVPVMRWIGERIQMVENVIQEAD